MLSPSTASSAAAASGVLYLHGFNSAGASPKARLIKAACAELGLPCETPDLSSQAADALRLAESLLPRLGPSPMLMGSSMGGFLATVLAERHELPLAEGNRRIHAEYARGLGLVAEQRFGGGIDLFDQRPHRVEIEPTGFGKRYRPRMSIEQALAQCPFECANLA